MFSCKEIKSFGSKIFEEQLGGITELCAQDDNIKDMTSHWHQSQEPSKEQKVLPETDQTEKELPVQTTASLSETSIIFNMSSHHCNSKVDYEKEVEV